MSQQQDLARTYAPLTEASESEVVTRVTAQDLPLPRGAGRAVVLTLHNDAERRPETLGPRSMVQIIEAVEQASARARAGAVDAVVLRGTAPTFAAGVDLTQVKELHAAGVDLRLIGSLGHDLMQAVREVPVPTLAFLTGTAMGGGLELALAADYRIAAADAKNISLPEVRLGLIPGWAGIYRLPRLIGPEQAARVIFSDPLNNGRSLKAAQALELGIVDAVTSAPATDPGAQEEALDWFAAVLTAERTVERPQELPDDQPLFQDGDGSAWQQRWSAAQDQAQQLVRRKTAGASQAAEAALEVFSAGPLQTYAQSREQQIRTLETLVDSEQFHACVYAMLELLQHRAKKPSMVPPQTEPATVQKVGVVGAGLMATQLAQVFLTQLQVPVLISDIAQERVDAGITRIQDSLQQLAQKGRMDPETAQRLGGLVSGTVDQADYADCDFVIEAVFEETSVKKQVFAGLEKHVRPDCILATNTSSLLVSEMVEDLEHPERVVGFHFFNPVAVMPLVEIVRTSSTDDRTTATAFALARGLRKTAVGARDSSGFIVNRILGVVLSEAGRALDSGASGEEVAAALQPLGLPMDPLTLTDLVGLPIAVHLLESLRRFQGPRFHVSRAFQALSAATIRPMAGEGGALSPEAQEVLEGLEQDQERISSDTLRQSTEDALAAEVDRMLEEGVVPDRADIDLAMILGAGWPLFNGGLTRYLDRSGAFERV